MQNIGVVTAGSDALGMSAAIRSVVRTVIFNGLKVVGIERGYAGLIRGKIRPVSGIINRGGTVLKTARCEKIKMEEDVKKATNKLKAKRIDGLIVVRGGCSFRGGK